MPACRFCGAPLQHTVVDLGMSPLCESYLRADQLDAMEPFFPLHVRVCTACWLVQLPEYVPPEEIFREYAYFSAYSDSWVEHARRYAVAMVDRLELGRGSFVVEVASNDGYLLQHFVHAGIPVLGIEPARNVAPAAEARGVPTLTEFFGHDLARKVVDGHGSADLVVANNVLAQVPDLNDFVAGLAALVEPRTGVATLEFPHLLQLVDGHQFDTIYHEHFSYFSLLTVDQVFAAHGLEVFDVEEIPTHGGSLRVHASHAGAYDVAGAVLDLHERERAAGVTSLAYYEAFASRVVETKHRLVEFLVEQRRVGRRLAGYGAPGKGNTLLNYCGIRTDLLEFTVDRNPYKHGRYLPGTHIPIHHPDHLAEVRPDVILVLPWNLRDEIAAQLAYTRQWGARLYVPIPTVREVGA